MGFGRHTGTIWPQIEAFVADAACKCGKKEMFENELKLMAERSVRDGCFAEIYHPVNGMIYGGRQEDNNNGIREWSAVLKQTWSATGFLRLIIRDLIGIIFYEDGIEFNPNLTEDINELRLENIHYRKAVLDISIRRDANVEKKVTVNGENVTDRWICEPDKKYNIEIII